MRPRCFEGAQIMPWGGARLALLRWLVPSIESIGAPGPFLVDACQATGAQRHRSAAVAQHTRWTRKVL
jgi:hypothetical protein